jgi:hypothetical protein
MFIPDPDFYFLPIPVPAVKNAPDLGYRSETLPRGRLETKERL